MIENGWAVFWCLGIAGAAFAMRWATVRRWQHHHRRRAPADTTKDRPRHERVAHEAICKLFDSSRQMMGELETRSTVLSELLSRADSTNASLQSSLGQDADDDPQTPHASTQQLLQQAGFGEDESARIARDLHGDASDPKPERKDAA